MNNNVFKDLKISRKSKDSLYLQIVDFICEKIATKEISIGEKLPSQRLLAKYFGVNRSTIVMAMDELESYGIIDTSYGGGTKVVNNSWSLLMSENPNWHSLLYAGNFKENQQMIQIINQLEFEDYLRLGTGELDPKLFCSKSFFSSCKKIYKDLNSLSYLPPLGLLELRKEIAKRHSDEIPNLNEKNILITSGSLQALHLISLGLLNADSVVLTENSSYLKSLFVFQSAGIQLHGIPMDKEGLEYWQMDDFLSHSDKNCVLYTIPTFHNPTNTVMSIGRRKDLLSYSSKKGLPIIEDLAYNELFFGEKPPSSLMGLDKDNIVISLGSFSKALAPGLRVGWIMANENIVKRLGDIKMQIDYGASSLSQWALYEFLKSGKYSSYLDKLRKELSKRKDNALQSLEKHMSHYASWNNPEGGFFIWLTFNKKIDIATLFKEALKKRILLNPGDIYSYRETNSIRLSYAYEDEKNLSFAIEKIAEILDLS